MTDGWIRSTSSNANNSGYYGSTERILVHPDQTALRSWWNIGLYYLEAGIDQYPPGSSILRAGLLYDVSGLDPSATPTPISQADADWLAITTINPSVVQLSRAVNVAWQINWGFPIDISVKSQRKNQTAEDHSLYICWEWGLQDQEAGFEIDGWWCSLDTYMRTP